MPRMLEELRNNHLGFPSFLFEEYYNIYQDTIPVSKEHFCRHIDYEKYKTIYSKADKWCNNKWNEILDRMIFLFDECDDEKCTMKNEYFDITKENKNLFFKRQRVEYQENCKKEALDMFINDALWD